MIPILYDETEKRYNSWGIGPLSDIINPRVREEANGLFYFTFEYPVNTDMYPYLKAQKKVVVDASPELKNQVFIITRVTKPISGVVEVYAEHISLYVTKNAGFNERVTFNGNALSALIAWRSALITEETIYLSSDITTKQDGTWELEQVQNARKVLGGVQGSILDRYGGEYKFNNLLISLLKSRGEDRGVEINWGKNLVDLVDDEDLNRVYTAIQPYAKLYVSEAEREAMSEEERKVADETILWLPEKILESEYSSLYANQRVALVDLGDKQVRNVDDLRTKALAYMKSNQFGVPKIDTKISYLDLSKTVEYKDVAQYERIDLFDTVTVNIEKYNIVNLKAKVIEVDYNPLLERYNEIRIGNTLSSRFSNNVGSAQQLESLQNKKISEINQKIIHVVEKAEGNALIFYTDVGDDTVPVANNVGDTWYKKLGDNKTILYVWNGVEWASLINSDNIDYEIREAKSEAIAAAEEARQALDEAIRASDRINVQIIDNEDGTKSMVDLTSGQVLYDIQGGIVQITKDKFYMDQTLITPIVKTTELNANQIKAGTIDFDTVNGININASNIVTGTISGGQSYWNLNTGELNIGDLLHVDASGAAALSEQAKSELKGDDGKDAIVVSSTAPEDTTRIWRKSLSDSNLYIYIDGEWISVNQEALSAISEKADIELLESIKQEMESQNAESSKLIGENEVTLQEVIDRINELKNPTGTGVLDKVQEDMQGLIEREVVWNQDKIDEIVASIQNQYPDLFRLTQRVKMDDTGTTFYATDSSGSELSTQTIIKNDGLYIQTDGVDTANFTREGATVRNLRIEDNVQIGNHMAFKSGKDYTIFSWVGYLEE